MNSWVNERKSMNRKKNAVRNIYWGILSKFVTLGLPFITRTVLIYTMGMNYVGLGSLFTSLLQVLSFTELGIGSALVFSMYKPIAENNIEKVNMYLNFYRKVYRIIGCIVLGLGLVMLPCLDFLVAGDIPEGINLQILFSVYLLNNIVGYFLFTYKQSILTASQRVDIISKRDMVIQCILGILQVGCLIFLHNYYVYVLLIPLATLLNNLLLAHITNKYYPQYRCEGNITKEELAILKKQVGGLVFQKIGNIVLTSVDTIVISAFLGLHILGIYQGYYYIITALAGILASIQSSLIPSIGNSVALNSVEKNLVDFKKFNFLYQWIAIWWCSCLLSLYQPFIRMWQGSENMLSNNMVILLVILFFSQKMNTMCWMYREAVGMWWENRFVPLISSIVNLVINITLVQIIGLPGIVISTIVSMIFVNFPGGSYALFNKYFKSKGEYKAYLLRNIRNFILMGIVAGITYFACSGVPEYGIFNFSIRLTICIIIPNTLLLLFNIKNKDFKEVVKFILGILPKKYIPRF